jgi:hypothetical protein
MHWYWVEGGMMEGRVDIKGKFINIFRNNEFAQTICISIVHTDLY